VLAPFEGDLFRKTVVPAVRTKPSLVAVTRPAPAIGFKFAGHTRESGARCGWGSCPKFAVTRMGNWSKDLVIVYRCSFYRYSIYNDFPVVEKSIRIMSGPASSAILVTARVSLRILIYLNWLYGTGILAILLLSSNTPWIMSAFQIAPSPEGHRLLWGLRLIALIGLCTIPLNYLFLHRLLAIVESVRAGNPFIVANAYRLRAIAWTLVALQCLGLVIGLIARQVATTEYPLDIDTGFSVTGLLSALVIFLLAQVFAEGTEMREELEGTV